MGVRHYKLVLMTSGPVHIGNGEQYGKKDYFANKGGIAILDVPRFIARLDSDDLEAYLAFLEEGARSSDRNLQVFLDEHPRAQAAAQDSIRYSIGSELSRARRGTYQYHDVSQFIKDAYGCPYVPGSSVKGMLRTALLTCLILNDRTVYEPLFDSMAARDRHKRKTVGTRIERRAFRQGGTGISGGADSAANDALRHISVSDSKPLSTADLVFVKKYDKFSKNDDGDHKMQMGRGLTDREGNALDVYRECLKPGTRVEFDVDIDERIDDLLGGLPKLDKGGLLSVLQRSFDRYEECFLSAFEAGSDAGTTKPIDDGRCSYVYSSGPFAGSRCRNNSVGGSGFCRQHQDCAASVEVSTEATCYLGGGTDFDVKTVVNALFDDKNERLYETSHILYEQFPTRLDPSKHARLRDRVRDAGFEPLPMAARYGKNGRLIKAKDDHRHWEDFSLGVSPHTMKLGIVGKDKYPMGRCSARIEDR